MLQNNLEANQAKLVKGLTTPLNPVVNGAYLGTTQKRGASGGTSGTLALSGLIKNLDYDKKLF